ncbi:MAG: hypothetical protein Q7S37_03565 [bacterium]|nr:hypothetical protein [bacterium]
MAIIVLLIIITSGFLYATFGYQKPKERPDRFSYNMPISNNEATLSLQFSFMEYDQTTKYEDDIRVDYFYNPNSRETTLTENSSGNTIRILANIGKYYTGAGSNYLKKSGTVRFCQATGITYDTWDGRHDQRISPKDYYYIPKYKILIEDNVKNDTSKQIIESICIEPNKD